MNIKTITGFLIFILPCLSWAQSELTLVDSLQLPQASIWGGISFNGENLSVTTTFHQPTPHLYLRKLDTALNQVGDIIPLTSDSDEVTTRHITDHKHLFLNNHHFVTFSVAGDSDLYIFKTDCNGKRVGAIVPVVEQTANRTNDMMFCTDAEKLYVAYFKPQSQSVVHTLDQNLNQVSPPLITSTQLPHNNLGGMLFHDDKFYMFTGDRFGTNANLILTIWNHDWTPAITSPRILIPAQPGEGAFFATGVAYDSMRKRWFIGFHHSKNNNPTDWHIDIAVFDENFALMDRKHGPNGSRPHFLLLEDHLYMVYDYRGGVYIHKYRVNEPTRPAVNWKPYFTLEPEEGIAFLLDSAVVIPNASVPGLNIDNEGRVILGYSGKPGGRGQMVSNDNGRTFTPLSDYVAAQAGDGAFIYLPDGRTRFITEELLPTSTPQRHKSRLVSWISYDGINWSREAGVRYQPGAEDDSIASVPAALQIADSVWRLYYVGDWYRTNGTRTAISTDWGWTWRPESKKNILRDHDVDPHPVYLTNGKIRIYHRHMKAPGGIAYTDGNGVVFDTTNTTMLLPDGVGFSGLLLDPAVIKFPNGAIACFIGAAPFFKQPGRPKIIAAWAQKSPGVEPKDGSLQPERIYLHQNYPNPFNSTTMIRFSLPRRDHVTLKMFDVHGREVATLVDGEHNPGDHSIVLDASRLVSAVYFYQIKSGPFIQTRKLLLIK